MTARSTTEVLEDHLERRNRGDIEGDLARNYAGDIVLLCEHGALKGHAAIRNSAKALADQLPEARFDISSKQSMASTCCCIGALDQQMRASILVWIGSSSGTDALLCKPFPTN